MSNVGRGSPVTDKNTVAINELIVEFLTTKKDNYDQDISYFKIVDPTFRVKLKPLFSLNDEGNLKMPVWVTDNNGYILKAKSKFIVNLQKFILNALHIINLNFEYYNMEDVVVRGYYAEITTIASTTPRPGMEIEADDDN